MSCAPWTGAACATRPSATWRKALAEAAHTTADRVAVQCVHPHNAPFADTEAEKLLEAVPGAPSSLDLKFFDRAVKSVADAVKASLAKTMEFTHVGTSQARVEKVASNRRIVQDGKVIHTRNSATKDAKVREFPEGLIDPWLKTLSFWKGEKPLAALHYYATHPMSYYGDGRVSADFCGLARQKRAQETGVFQVYFTGCAGNITAGKYNDGAKENRAVLRDRVHEAMAAAWKNTERRPIKDFSWRSEPVKFRPRRRRRSARSNASRFSTMPPRPRPGAVTRRFNWPG